MKTLVIVMILIASLAACEDKKSMELEFESRCIELGGFILPDGMCAFEYQVSIDYKAER